MMKKSILFVLTAILAVSCATRKDVIYFQDLEKGSIPQPDPSYTYPKIQIGDILKIDITAMQEEALIPFRFEKIEMNQGRNLEVMKLEGYEVGKDGTINYPGLGDVKLAGMTTREAQKHLEGLLSENIINPSVKVRLLNFQVTVLGEVNNPGTYTITEERVTLPQVLGLAGDFTIKGRRDNVLIIREVNNVRQEVRIDFTKTDWMNGPYFHMKQNDVVYVEPNNPKVKSAGYIGNVGTILSVVSILLSATVIIVNASK